ncbi:MAG: hypothetical protein Q7K42_01510, partial [Candidatus Diapherotrites archaeon]|nr:hypothetical protein [Candidatus Diapherotrites archaeon]
MPKNSEKTPKLKGLEEIRFEMVKKRHKQTLLKAILDKKVDEELIPFLLAMAEKQLYFTSSSCAGRIILLGFQGEEKKGNSFFHRKWHRQITFPELMEGILAFNSGSLWFKQESFILHIGCANLKDAEKILELMHSAGVKRGGIIVTK